MYFLLTESLKRRFIFELQRYWSYHPRYRDIVNNIQGKYSFDTRPQYGMILKTSGGNHVRLSADNYKGIVQSYCYLTKFQNNNGLAIEWVVEDSIAIQNNGGVFPSAPGVYFIDLTADDEFYVDPLYDMFHDQGTLTGTTLQLSHPFVTNTLRLYEQPQGFQLHEGVNYTVILGGDGNPTGQVELVQAPTGGRTLTADYRFAGESRGPFGIIPNRANNTAIPGVVLAFGRRCEKGDRMAVVVHDIRRLAALEYGGRWDLTLELEVIARDVHAQQELTDWTAIYLEGILRSHLSTEGIEIMEVSMGGESEEVYDEAGDDYFYMGSLSMTVQTEWSLHVPLTSFLRMALPQSVEEARVVAGMTETELIGQTGNIQMLESLGLETTSDPFFAGRTDTFELLR